MWAGYGLFDQVSYLAEEKFGYTFKSRYVDPYSDFGAKKIFGDKQFLTTFYKHLLQKYTVFNALEFTSSEALGKTREDRSAIFHLNSRNEKRERIALEMQKEFQPDFMSRIIYYATFPIQDQVRKGKRKTHKYRLNKVFMVGILNFNLDDGDQYLKEYSITERSSNETREELTIIILQMPKFKKKEDELKTSLDKYLYGIKNMRNLTQRPKALFEEEYKRLFELAEVANLTREEMKAYERSLQLQMDDENRMQYKLEIHEKKGIKKGIVRTAKNFKKNGASIELIMKSTGLTKEQIQQL